MSPERVKVVTDSGCSIRPECPEYRWAREHGVTIIPLEFIIFENDQDVPYPEFDITPQEFYLKMRETLDKYGKLPTTSGSIAGRAYQTYIELSKETSQILSVHLTGKHSAVLSSAVGDARRAQDELKGQTRIVPFDSQNLSIGMWYLVKKAAKLSDQGASLEQVKQELEELRPKVKLLTVIESFENLRRGGRADEIIQAWLAVRLSIYPILGLREGKLTRASLVRGSSPERARKKMIEIVSDSGDLKKVSVLHTNAPDLSNQIKEALAKKFKGEIAEYEAGPVLGVHAGPRAVGVVYQLG